MAAHAGDAAGRAKGSDGSPACRGDPALWATLSASAHGYAVRAAERLHARCLDPQDVAQMALLMLWQRHRTEGAALTDPAQACAWLRGTVWILTLAARTLELRRRYAVPLGRPGPFLHERCDVPEEARHLDYAGLARELERDALPQAFASAVRLLAFVQNLDEVERLTGAPRSAIAGQARFCGWIRHEPARRERLAQARDPVPLMQEAGLTLAEIAAVTGQREGTLRMRLHREQGAR